MKENIDEIKQHVLKRLYGKKAYKKGHLLFERLQGGLPKHLRGLVSHALEQLIKEELVTYYGKTLHGDAYQLNIAKLREIEQILAK